MAAGDLVQMSDAQAWAGADVTATMITAASAQIQVWIGYKIAPQDYTRTFSGVGGSTLFVPDRPLTAVASLTIDGVTIPASPGAPASGYLFDDKAIYLSGFCFGRGVRNIVATYTAGYATVPADIAQACLVLIKSVIDRAARESDLVQMRAGDTAVTYNRQNRSDKLGQLPSEAMALLAPYRRVAPC